MARLALQIAGGIIGGLLALPTGGVSVALGFSLGSAVGSLVGMLAFPGKGTHVYGPRLNDMQVSGSSPGTPIPLLFGSMRLGGTIIWSGGLLEVSTDSTQSAKGGPSVTNTTYTYFVSFAAAFCSGVGQVTRVWGDSKLIYNKGGNTYKGNWNSGTTYAVGDVVSVGTTYYQSLHISTNQNPASGGFFGGLLGDLYWATCAKPADAGNVAKNVHVLPTLYTGTDTQLPDPLMVSHDGADKVPGYRGVCYAVWEKFPLVDFGNRLPNIRAEVHTNAQPAPQTVLLGYESTHDASGPTFVAQSPDGKTLWTINQKGTADPNFVYIERMDLLTNTVSASGFITNVSSYPGFNASGGGTDQPPTGPFVADAFGNLWMPGTVGQHATIFKVDGRTFQVIGDAKLFFAVSGDVPGFPPYSGAAFATPLGLTLDASGTKLLGMSYYSNWSGLSINSFAFYTIDCKTGNILGQLIFDNTATPIPQVYPVCDEANNVYILTNGAGGSGWSITKFNLNGPVAIFIPAPNPPYQLAGGLYSDVGILCTFPNDAITGTAQAMFYCQDDHSLILFTSTGAIIKLDASTGEIISSVGGTGNPQVKINSGFIGLGSWLAMSGSGYGSGATENKVQEATLGRSISGLVFGPAVSNQDHLAVFSAASLAKIAEYDLKTFPSMNSGMSFKSSWRYDPSSDSVLLLTNGTAPGWPTTFPKEYAVYRLYLDRISASGNTAAFIVQTICERAGIPLANIDVSRLTEINVTGYPVPALQTGKDIINVLGSAFFFEGRESDFKAQFIPRGQSVSATIVETELGLMDDKAELVENIGQEQDLPKEVEIIHIDQLQDYQQNKQHKVRHHRVRKTINKTSISLPLVLTPRQAEQLADRILWTADLERRTYKANLWKSYWLLLDPCDVINFNYNSVQLTGRIAKMMLGQNRAIALEITAEDSNTYLSVAAGNSNSGFIPQIIAGLASTQLWLLDVPYLRDQDADGAGNTGFYAIMGPSDGGTWPAGLLFKSSDGQRWEQMDASPTEGAYGICTTVLPAPRSPYVWDYVNNLTVQLVQGSAPTSDTDLNVLNGANAILLYPSLEVIQFKDAVDNLDGTYTLSSLLRGRRGTEWACGTAAVGEFAFFITQGGVLHEQVPLAAFGSDRVYKPVTAGADISTGAPQTLTLRSRDLMPYAPSHVVGNKTGGDWTFGWVRRTRLGGDWLNGGEAPGVYGGPQDGLPVPLNEDGQGYDVEILDTDNVTVKRSGTVTSNRFQYLAADQIADFGGLQTTVRLNVYQRSAQVGRGFVANVLINVSSTLPSVDTSPAMDVGATGDTITWGVE